MRSIPLHRNFSILCAVSICLVIVFSSNQYPTIIPEIPHLQVEDPQQSVAVSQHVISLTQTLENTTLGVRSGPQLVKSYFGTYMFSDPALWYKKDRWSNSTSLGHLAVDPTTTNHKGLIKFLNGRTTVLNNSFNARRNGTIELWLKYSGNSADMFSFFVFNDAEGINGFTGSFFIRDNKFYTVQGPRSMHGGQGSLIYTYLRPATPNSWYIISLSFLYNNTFTISINGTKFGNFLYYEDLLVGNNRISFQSTLTPGSGGVFLDSMGYSWDLSYNNGDLVRRAYDMVYVNKNTTLSTSFTKLIYQMTFGISGFAATAPPTPLIAVYYINEVSFPLEIPTNTGSDEVSMSVKFELVLANYTTQNWLVYYQSRSMNTDNFMIGMQAELRFIDCTITESRWNITSYMVNEGVPVDRIMTYGAEFGEVELIPVSISTFNVWDASGHVVTSPTAWQFSSMRVPMPGVNEYAGIVGAASTTYADVWSFEAAHATVSSTQVQLTGVMNNTLDALFIRKNPTTPIKGSCNIDVSFVKRDLEFNVEFQKNGVGIDTDAEIKQGSTLADYCLRGSIDNPISLNNFTTLPGNKDLVIQFRLPDSSMNRRVTVPFSSLTGTSITLEYIKTALIASGFNFIPGHYSFTISATVNGIDLNSIFKATSHTVIKPVDIKFQPQIHVYIDETTDDHVSLVDASQNLVHTYMSPNIAVRMHVTDYYGMPLTSSASTFRVSVTESAGAWNRFVFNDNAGISRYWTQSGESWNYSAGNWMNEASNVGKSGYPNTLLLDATQVNTNRLLVTPNVMSYDDVSNSSRQVIEIDFELDLIDILGAGADLQDIVAIYGDMWGGLFLDPRVAWTDYSFSGTLDIFNYAENDWVSLLAGSTPVTATQRIDFNNADFTSSGYANCRFPVDLSHEDIESYADPSMRLFFKLKGEYNGKYGITNNYLTNLIGSGHQREMFAAIVDFLRFNVTTSRNPVSFLNTLKTTTLNQIPLSQRPLYNFDYQYNFLPSIPTGTATVDAITLQVDVDSLSSFYLDDPRVILEYNKIISGKPVLVPMTGASGLLHFTVDRVPTSVQKVGLQHVVPPGYSPATQNYSSLPLNISARVINTLHPVGAPVINARVQFFVEKIGVAGSKCFVGEAFTDGRGIAWINRDLDGNYLRYNMYGDLNVSAVVMPNYGNSTHQFVDELLIGRTLLFKHDNCSGSIGFVIPHVIQPPMSLIIDIQNVPNDNVRLIASDHVYMRAILRDMSIGNPGIWVFNQLVDIYLDDVKIMTVDTCVPFSIPLTKNGVYKISVAFPGNQIYPAISTDVSGTSRNVECIRLELIALYSSVNYVGEQWIIEVEANDMLTGQGASGVGISLQFNSVLLEPVQTGADGIARFIGTIPIDAANLIIPFSISLTPASESLYGPASAIGQITIGKYNVVITPTLNITGNSLPAGETVEIQVDLQNLQTSAALIGNLVNFTIRDDTYYTYIYVVNHPTGTPYHFTPLHTGSYRIDLNSTPSAQYAIGRAWFILQAITRPTHIEIDMNDLPLIPLNNFSVSVRLIDSISSDRIPGMSILVFREYVGGLEPNATVDWTMTTSLDDGECTFNWMPLKRGSFNFTYTFAGTVDYSAASFDELYIVDGRMVELTTLMLNETAHSGDMVNFSVSARGLDFPNAPIQMLNISFYIVIDEIAISISINITNDDGVAYFSYLIPLDMAGRSFTCVATSAITDVYNNSITWDSFTVEYFGVTPSVIITGSNEHFIGETVTIQFNIKDEFGQFLNIHECNIVTINATSGVVLESTLLPSYLAGWNEISMVFSSQGMFGIMLKFTDESGAYQNVSEFVLLSILKRSVDLTIINFPAILFNSAVINATLIIVDDITRSPVNGYSVNFSYANEAGGFTEILVGTTDADGIINFVWVEWETISESPVKNITILIEGFGNSMYLAMLASRFINITKDQVLFSLKTNTTRSWAYINEDVNFTLNLIEKTTGLMLSGVSVDVSIVSPAGTWSFTIADNSLNNSFIISFEQLGLYNISFTFAGDDTHFAKVTVFSIHCAPRPVMLDITSAPSLDIAEIRYPITFTLEVVDALIGQKLPGVLVMFSYLDLESDQTVEIGTATSDANGLCSITWIISDSLVNRRISFLARYSGNGTFDAAEIWICALNVTRIGVSLAFVSKPALIRPLNTNTFVIQVLETRSGIPVAGQRVNFTVNMLGIITPFSGITNASGVVILSWTPPVEFYFQDSSMYIAFLEETPIYQGGTTEGVVIPHQRMTTSIDITPSKTVDILPAENVEISYALQSQFGSYLGGRLLHVHEAGLNYTRGFDVTSGNGLSSFLFTPTIAGRHEITISFVGESRYGSATSSAMLYAGKMNWTIFITVSEVYTINVSCGAWGQQHNLHVPDYYNNLTIVAVVYAESFGNFTMAGLPINFYYLTTAGGLVTIGTGITNDLGIATVNWAYPKPQKFLDFLKSIALQASINETLDSFESKSNPVYLTIRPIMTFFEQLPYNKVTVNHSLNVTVNLRDEFFLNLVGKVVDVRISRWLDKHGHSQDLVEARKVVIGVNSSFLFTPGVLGYYDIVCIYNGSNILHGTSRTFTINCTSISTAFIRVSVADIEGQLIKGYFYNVTINLVDENETTINGQILSVSIRRFVFYLEREMIIVTGINNTFSFYFEEEGAYVFEVTYAGNGSYEENYGEEVLVVSSLDFKISDWILFLLFCWGGLCITSVKVNKKSDKKSRKFIKFMAILLGFMFFCMDFVLIDQKGCQLPVYGLVDTLNVDGPEPINDSEIKQETYSDMLDVALSEGNELVSQSAEITSSIIENSLQETSTDLSINDETDASNQNYDIITNQGSVIFSDIEDVLDVVIISPDNKAKIVENLTIVVEINNNRSSIYDVSFYIKQIINGENPLVYHDELKPSQLFPNSINRFDNVVNTLLFEDGEYELIINASDNSDIIGSAKCVIDIQNQVNPVADVESEKLIYFISVEIGEIIELDLAFNKSVVVYFNLLDMSGNILCTHVKPLGMENYSLWIKADDEIVIGTYSLDMWINFNSRIERRTLIIDIVKKATQIEMIIENPNNIKIPEQVYTNTFINFVANVTKIQKASGTNDIAISRVPIAFYIYQNGDYKQLGVRITDHQGLARFNGFSFTDLDPKYKYFIKAEFGGNERYKASEGNYRIENLGNRSIYLFDQDDECEENWVTPTAFLPFNRGYNDRLNLKVQLSDTSGLNPMINQRMDLYACLNYSNYNNSEIYLQSDITDHSGIALFDTRLSLDIGTYDLCLRSSKNDSIASNEDLLSQVLHIVKESTSVSLNLHGASEINAKYMETINIKAIIKDDERNPIPNKNISFYVDDGLGTHVLIGKALSDYAGRATINYLVDLLPRDACYSLHVVFDGDTYFETHSMGVNLFVNRITAEITFQTEDILFGDLLTVCAKIYDPFDMPVVDEIITCNITNKMDGDQQLILQNRTDDSGEVRFDVEFSRYMNYIDVGEYNVTIILNPVSGSKYDYIQRTEKFLEGALRISCVQPQIFAQIPASTYFDVLVPLNLTILGPSNIGIANAEFIYTIYDSDNEFVKSRSAATDANGNFNENIGYLYPDKYKIVIRVYESLPNYIETEETLFFETLYVQANLKIEYFSSAQAHRGESVEITVGTEHPNAKRTSIPLEITIFDANHAFIVDAEVTMVMGHTTFIFGVPNTFQAGQYNISFIIDPNSGYLGDTYFLLDVVEYTVLQLEFVITNEVARNRPEGKFFIYEEFEIIYNLVDQDGQPVPEAIVDCNQEINVINREYNINIFNGEVYQASRFIDLLGFDKITYTPNRTDLEYVTGHYVGDRFFESSSIARDINVLRRPVEIIYTNVYHNNSARALWNTFVNRNDLLTVEGWVKDILTGSGIYDLTADLYADGEYLVSEETDRNGQFKFDYLVSQNNNFAQANYHVISVCFNGNYSHKETSRTYEKAINVIEYLNWEIEAYKTNIGSDGAKILFEINLRDQDNLTLWDYPIDLIVNATDKNGYSSTIFQRVVKSGSIQVEGIKTGDISVIAKSRRVEFLQYENKTTELTNDLPFTNFYCPIYLFKEEDAIEPTESAISQASLPDIDYGSWTYWRSLLQMLLGYEEYEKPDANGFNSDVGWAALLSYEDAQPQEGELPPWWVALVNGLFNVSFDWRDNCDKWLKLLIWVIWAVVTITTAIALGQNWALTLGEFFAMLVIIVFHIFIEKAIEDAIRNYFKKAVKNQYFGYFLSSFPVALTRYCAIYIYKSIFTFVGIGPEFEGKEETKNKSWAFFDIDAPALTIESLDIVKGIQYEHLKAYAQLKANFKEEYPNVKYSESNKVFKAYKKEHWDDAQNKKEIFDQVKTRWQNSFKWELIKWQAIFILIGWLFYELKQLNTLPAEARLVFYVIYHFISGAFWSLTLIINLLHVAEEQVAADKLKKVTDAIYAAAIKLAFAYVLSELVYNVVKWLCYLAVGLSNNDKRAWWWNNSEVIEVPFWLSWIFELAAQALKWTVMAGLTYLILSTSALQDVISTGLKGVILELIAQFWLGAFMELVASLFSSLVFNGILAILSIEVPSPPYISNTPV